MDDYISRQAAIDMLWKALYDYEDKTEKQFQDSDELDIGDWFGHRIFVQNMNDIDRQTILELPSADVAPVRHGRWERHYSRPGVYADLFWHCSVCGSKQSGYVDWFKYCPNCGARMDGEQDETD